MNEGWMFNVCLSIATIDIYSLCKITTLTLCANCVYCVNRKYKWTENICIIVSFYTQTHTQRWQYDLLISSPYHYYLLCRLLPHRRLSSNMIRDCSCIHVSGFNNENVAELFFLEWNGKPEATKQKCYKNYHASAQWFNSITS